MDHERLAGMCEQWAGKLQEHWGVLTGDNRRRATGISRQHAGRVRELRALARQAAQRQLQEFQAQHRGWHRPWRSKAAVVSLAEQRSVRTARPRAERARSSATLVKYPG